MNNDELFLLWGKVLKGDKTSRKEFIAVYKEHGYGHEFLWENPDKKDLHTMYLHLYKKLGKKK